MPARRKSRSPRRSPRRSKSRSKSPRRVLKRRTSGKARTSPRAAVRRSPKRRTYKGVDARVYGADAEKMERKVDGPILLAPLANDERSESVRARYEELAREIQELERARVRDPSSTESKERLALHTEITEKLERMYPDAYGLKPGDASLEIDEPPSSSEELAEETKGPWDELTRRTRIFPRDVVEYEGEVDEILSRNVGTEQLEEWLQSAFDEAEYSYEEWTSQANDVPDPGDFHYKREQVMKMVQQKIREKL